MNTHASPLGWAVAAEADEQRGGAGGSGVPGPPAEHLALVEAVNLGKPGAFAALFHAFNPFVLRVASRLSADVADVLDVQQAVWMYVARKFPGFVLTGKFTTFLYPVVRHEAGAVRRKRQRLGAAGSVEHLGSLAPPTAGAAGHDDEGRLLRLERVLADLSAVHREVVLMRFVDDLSLEEIAHVLDVPLGTVKSRLHNAIAALRADERCRGWLEGT
jgi:RNA polymerase sigma-70 factor, ECF subfamily